MAYIIPKTRYKVFNPIQEQVMKETGAKIYHLKLSLCLTEK